MVQPKNRRFVMEDRLDAELATLNTEIDSKVTGPVDNAEIADGAVTSSKIADGTIVEGDLADGAVTSAKIADGTIVDADVNASAAIAYTKVTRPPLSNASDVTLTSPTSGQALTYNGTGWVNSTPVNSLSGLSDVTITSPVGGEVVKYNAATSKWVNGAAAGGVTASDTAPALATAAAGDAWFDTNDGTLYVCYVDPDSTKQWVQVQANSALEGSILARLGSLESQSIAFGSLSPNYLINGGFDIFQRASFASRTTGGYCLDRWFAGVGGTVTITQQTSGLPAGSANSMRVAYNAASSFANIFQPIESQNVSMMKGRPVTFSVRLRRNASFTAGLNVAIERNATADTATGGTWTNIGLTFVPNSSLPTGTGSSDWFFATVTATVPNDSTANGLRVLISESAAGPSGAYWEATTAQLEVGSVATSFRRNAPSIQAELAACQRYYFRMTGTASATRFVTGVAASTTNWSSAAIITPVPMRIIPTVSLVGTFALSDGVTIGWSGNGSNFSNFPIVQSSVYPAVSISTASGLVTYRTYNIEGNDNSARYMEFSAEL